MLTKNIISGSSDLPNIFCEKNYSEKTQMFANVEWKIFSMEIQNVAEYFL